MQKVTAFLYDNLVDWKAIPSPPLTEHFTESPRIKESESTLARSPFSTPFLIQYTGWPRLCLKAKATFDSE